MNRLIAILSTVVLSLFLLVPAVAAAEPWAWGNDEHVVVSTGGDFTLEPDQSTSLLVIVSGNATIRGHAKGVVVISGTADFVGSDTRDIAAISSTVTLDADSHVSNDIQQLSSTIHAPSGSVGGRIEDLALGLGGTFALGTVASALLYLSISIALVVVALTASALAGRQTREAGASIRREPVNVIVAAIVSFIVLMTAGILAIVTVLGAALGFGILLIAFPLMLFAGYVVAGIALGDAMVARLMSDGRERPALGAFVGMVTLTVIGILPVISGLVGFIGFGAVSLRLYRTMRASSGAPRTSTFAAAPSAS